MNVNKCERKKKKKKLTLFYHSQFNWNFKYQKDKVFYQVGIVGFFFLFSITFFGFKKYRYIVLKSAFLVFKKGREERDKDYL